MQIRVGFQMVYEFAARTPVVLMLNVHPSRATDMIEPDQLRITPALPVTRYLDAFGNLCFRRIRQWLRVIPNIPIARFLNVAVLVNS